MITYHDPIMQLIHLQKIAIKRGNLENKYQIDIFKVQQCSEWSCGQHRIRRLYLQTQVQGNVS